MTKPIRNPRGPRRTPAPLLALFAIVVLVAACGGAASAPILSTVGSAIDDQSGGGGGAPENAPPDLAYGGGQRTKVLDAVRPDLLIIKTGSLDLQVKDVGVAVNAAAAKLVALGGYVSGSEQSGDGENVTATVTYRLPADQWEPALTALRGLAIKVVAERTGTEDVTGQVVDLRARIKNLQATEKALQAIMTQATKITDVLEVQAELTRVRGQIEEATAQKLHLEEQAAYSTLVARFGTEPEPAVITSQKKFDPQTEVDRASASLVEVLQGLATAGIWFGIVWLPVLFALGLLALIGLMVVRRVLPRRAADPAPSSLVPPA